MNLSRVVLASVFLLPLIGCSPVRPDPPRVIEVPKIVKQYPPADLLRNCPVAKYEPGHDWQWVAQWAFKNYESLVSCDQDKAALRDWSARP